MTEPRPACTFPARTIRPGRQLRQRLPHRQALPVDGTPYDLRAPEGTPLGKQFFDDNWSHLTWTNGAVTVKVIDPAAHYGVEIQGLSPEIKTIQAYAPPTASFVAIEDQYNFADPFGKEWGKMDTGMVTLKPGQSTRWHVRLKVFRAVGLREISVPHPAFLAMGGIRGSPWFYQATTFRRGGCPRSPT